jgi:hypothetical protein
LQGAADSASVCVCVCVRAGNWRQRSVQAGMSAGIGWWVILCASSCAARRGV